VTLEEREDIATQLPPDNHLALSINDMDLKHRFRGIETDCLNRMHVPDTLVKRRKNSHHSYRRPGVPRSSRLRSNP